MIPPERLFWPCIVCGDENRYIDMFLCLNCNEPICQECVRQDGFCSDECYDTFHENGDEDYEDYEDYDE